MSGTMNIYMLLHYLWTEALWYMKNDDVNKTDVFLVFPIATAWKLTVRNSVPMIQHLFLTFYYVSIGRSLAQSVRAFSLHAEGWVFELGRDIPKSLHVNKIVAIPLLNARQQVWVSRVLADDHYERMSRVTVVIAGIEPSLLYGHDYGVYMQNLQSFADKDDN